MCGSIFCKKQKVGTVRGALAAQGSPRAQITSSSRTFSATLRGRWGLRGNPFTIAITPNRQDRLSTDLAFPRSGHPGWEDSACSRIDVAGPLSSPADLDGEGFPAGFHLPVRDHEVRGAEIGVEWKGRTLTVVPASLSPPATGAEKSADPSPCRGSGTGDCCRSTRNAPGLPPPLLVPSFREIERKGTLQIRGIVADPPQLAPDARDCLQTWRTSDSRSRLQLPPLSLRTRQSGMPSKCGGWMRVCRGTISALARSLFSALSIKPPHHARTSGGLRTSIPQSWPISPGSHREYRLQAEMELPALSST